MTIARPLYRNGSGEVISVGGTLYPPGARFSSSEWPRAYGQQPCNESARRIARYFARRRHAPFLPKSPLTFTGEIFLPAILHPLAPFETALPGVPTEFALPPEDDCPRYRIGSALRIGDREYAIGDVATYLGWPPMFLRPANKVAEAVDAYLKANGRHPSLLSAPWCLYCDDVFLPELPSYERAPSEQQLPPTSGVRYEFIKRTTGAIPERARRQREPATER